MTKKKALAPKDKAKGAFVNEGKRKKEKSVATQRLDGGDLRAK